jgi:hypothetical protein
MPTLKQEIDSIAFYAGRINDTILKEAIKISYLNNLAMVLRREYDKTKSFRSSAIYTLKCVELSKVNSTDCCSTDLGCKILKTGIKIPRPIIVKDLPDFNYVGGIDLNNERRIDYILPSEIEWFKYRKYSSKLPYYTYMNDYIYVFNTLTLKKIKVRYSPANPIELFELDCDASCFDTDEDVVIDPDLAAIVRPLIYNEIGLAPLKENTEINVT